MNLNDGATTLGFPFDNIGRVYSGSNNDALLNLGPARAADPVAVEAMTTSYATTGVLERPLITLHTDRPAGPFVHEKLTRSDPGLGAFITRHLPIKVNRFEHCNFTRTRLASFAIMLFYDGALAEISGTASFLSGRSWPRSRPARRRSAFPIDVREPGSRSSSRTGSSLHVAPGAGPPPALTARPP